MSIKSKHTLEKKTTIISKIYLNFQFIHCFAKFLKLIKANQLSVSVGQIIWEREIAMI